MRHRFRQTVFKAAAALLAALCSLMAAADLSHAESAVDTLTIRVGYTGMELERYATAGTWNWAKLYHELPMDSRAYSYFQSPGASDNPTTDSISTKTYNAIVDSANGFYITDLLDYAGLYISDIYNIGFYVTDHDTIWTAFDTPALFEDRYYFNDLAAHRVETEDGYDFSDAWNDCEKVAPMLAIEDNWASYTEKFESIGPDFTDVKPGNRFHLMFGQTAPTQQLTRESAKYIDCLYVTLKGQPEFTTEDVELDGTMGSHTTTMRTKVDNEAVIRQAKDLLDLRSTNESVLQIRNVRVIRDEDYSDLATVVIDYEIVGKGTASIVGSFGGEKSELQFETQAVEGGAKPKNDEEQKDASDPEGNKDGKQQKDSKDKKKNKDTGKQKEQNKSKKQAKDSTQGKPSDQSASKNGQSGSAQTGSEKVDLRGGRQTDRPDSGEQKAAQTKKSVNGRAISGVFKLSGQLHDQLKGSPQTEERKSDTEDVTKLKVYEDKAKKDMEERRRLIATALGSLGVMGTGAVWEGASFRLRLRKKRTRVRKGA